MARAAEPPRWLAGCTFSTMRRADVLAWTDPVIDQVGILGPHT